MKFIINLLIVTLSLIFIAKRLGITKKKFHINVFFFFTNLSIILAMLFGISELIYSSNTILKEYLKLYLVTYITIVMLVYNLVLAPKAKKDKLNYDLYSIYDIIAHIIVPILVIVEWIFFSPHQTLSLTAIFFGLIFPLLYCGLVFLKVITKKGKVFKHSNNHYPYFFFEIETYGTKKVIFNIISLLVILLLFILVLILINNYLLI